MSYFRNFVKVTYVTGCYRITPNAQGANISYSTQLELFFKDRVCLQNSIGGGALASRLSQLKAHYITLQTLI